MPETPATWNDHPSADSPPVRCFSMSRTSTKRRRPIDSSSGSSPLAALGVRVYNAGVGGSHAYVAHAISDCIRIGYFEIAKKQGKQPSGALSCVASFARCFLVSYWTLPARLPGQLKIYGEPPLARVTAIFDDSAAPTTRSAVSAPQPAWEGAPSKTS